MQKIIDDIYRLAERIDRPVTLMEVCGTHTEVIAKYGLCSLLPANVKLISGPGCPVCVTDQEDIDNIVELALHGLPIATYGDMLKVPGNRMSLEEARGQGAKVFAVYSAEEVFNNPHIEELVFFGIGFDTTAPMTASIIKRGAAVYSAHKHFVPAMEALVKGQEINIDGFIDPGHVSTIIGTKSYAVLEVPQVVAGFELEDVLIAIHRLLRQIQTGKHEVENEYARSVRKAGNLQAQRLLNEVFDIKEAVWRGFGPIAHSGYEIKQTYQALDAKKKYAQVLKDKKIPANPKLEACQCAQVIKGLIDPPQCKLFGRHCTPEDPLGPCMVSREGACNVKFRFTPLSGA